MSCRPKRGSGFPGYAFVANQEGLTLAVVDLTSFSPARHIRLEAGPTAVAANPARKTVYALTPETGMVHQVDPLRLSVNRKTRVARRAVSMRLAPDGDSLWVLSSEPRELRRVRLDHFQADRRIALPGGPVDMDLSRDGLMCAVSYGVEGFVSLLDLRAGRAVATVHAGTDTGTVRFRFDGEQLLVADRSRRLVTILETATGRTVTNLQVAVKPEHFCIKPDGGEVFVTGEGMDAVVILDPYSTQVSETVLAGRAPGAMAMAASQPYLFVTNPPSGDVTIFNVDTRRAIAVVAVGSEPAYVTMTPDHQYALVLNRRSGNMAVIRIGAIVPSRSRSAPLFTTVPVGSKPVCAAVLAV